MYWDYFRILHNTLFLPPSPPPLPIFAKPIVLKCAYENMQFAWEHLITIVYDNFNLGANRGHLGDLKIMNTNRPTLHDDVILPL